MRGAEGGGEGGLCVSCDRDEMIPFRTCTSRQSAPMPGSTWRIRGYTHAESIFQLLRSIASGVRHLVFAPFSMFDVESTSLQGKRSDPKYPLSAHTPSTASEGYSRCPIAGQVRAHIRQSTHYFLQPPSESDWAVRLPSQGGGGSAVQCAVLHYIHW